MLNIFARIPGPGLWLGIIFSCSPFILHAQCYGYQRIYASSEEANSNVTSNPNPLLNNTDVGDPGNAVGNNLTDFSTITVPGLAVTRFQRLKFPATYTSGEPIHVKLASSVNLSLFGITLEIQAFKSGAAVGTKVVVSSPPYLSLLSGENISDLIISSPGSSYDAVQVTVKGSLAASGQIRIYAVYVRQAATSAIDCETPADIIYGTTSGVLSSGNGVSNPANAADNSLTSYAIINKDLGVAGYVHLTTLLPSPAVAGDLMSIVLQVPGTPLLSADVFSNLSVVLYLGNTLVTTVPANDAGIKVRLLDATNDIYRITYPVSAAFDRISVQAGGLASAFSQVYVYDVRRLVPEPVASIDGSAAVSKSFCGNAQPSLTVSPQSCTTYKWYDAASGGQLLATGNSYAPAALSPGTYHFYAEASRNNCSGSVSERTDISITVLPKITSASINIISN